MLNSVKAAIEKYNMSDGVTEVTVALSGGADSVALLCCLKELSEELSITVYAAHLNHCLRGAEADCDEAFVKSLCKDLDVELFCEKVDVKSFADEHSMSIELAAREVRYAFLERVKKGVIATAHTANDNLETVLFNIARGTGIAGLCGIPPKRGNIIRPLINVTRKQVEDYCSANGLQFCTDSTNRDQSYSRNRIRHSVVPELFKINSNAVSNAQKMSETLRDDADYLNSQAEASLKEAELTDGLSVTVLNTLHRAIKTRCIVRYYEKCVGRTPEHIHIESVLRLLQSDFGKVSVQNGFSAVLKNGVLYFVPGECEKLSEILIENLPFSCEGFEVRKFSAENFRNTDKFNNLLLNNALDYDKICGKLTLRGRKPNDKISISRRNCTKSFKKLMNEAKIPEHLRDGLKVLADDCGVVWLEGFGADKRVAVSHDTKNIIILTVDFEGKI